MTPGQADPMLSEEWPGGVANILVLKLDVWTETLTTSVRISLGVCQVVYNEGLKTPLPPAQTAGPKVLLFCACENKLGRAVL